MKQLIIMLALLLCYCEGVNARIEPSDFADYNVRKIDLGQLVITNEGFFVTEGFDEVVPVEGFFQHEGQIYALSGIDKLMGPPAVCGHPSTNECNCGGCKIYGCFAQCKHKRYFK